MSGELALVFVVLVRTLVPLTIFRWRLAGALLAIAADAADVMTFQKFGSGPLTDQYYHNFDKLFDIYYLFIEFLVALKWTNSLARNTAKTLFIWRLFGSLIFELSSLWGKPVRVAFLLAPNIFENFYIFWTAATKWLPAFRLNKTRLIIILLAIGIPKIAQEYIMHYRFQDQVWAFLRDRFLFWLY